MNPAAQTSALRFIIRGRATGSIFVTAFGVIWIAISASQSSAWWLLALLFVGAALLLAPSIQQIQQAKLLKAPPPTQAERDFAKRLGTRLRAIFGVEILAITVTALLLAVFGQANYIVAATAFIVGVHFLPLARLFGINFYYIVGSLIAAWAVLATLLLHSPTRDIAVGLVTGILLWITALYLLALNWALQRKAGLQIPRR